MILTIDVGTSALKVVLYHVDGRLLATTAQLLTHQTPESGWAEADPGAWWAALLAAVAELRAQDIDLAQVQVIGVTGQMHTAVLLDAAGQPLPPTILWLDRRAVAETAELRQQLGLPPSRLNSAYTLPKLLWLARHRPDVLAQTRTLLWPKDYLRYRLTGQLATDVTEAGGAALFDEQTQAWATDRLALVGLSPAVLPPIHPATADAGPLLPAAATALGLSPAAKVIVGAGDVLALLGGAPPRPHRLTCSLGSSAMISCPLTGTQHFDDPAHRLYIYPFLPYRLLNGVLSTSGAALTWAWQALYEDQPALETAVAAALATEPGGHGLFFLPYLAGERSPYWNDQLRGGFYGLMLGHSRCHMLRAVLEGVAFSLRHLIDIAEELGVPIHEIALAGGGASTPGWPQLIADVCQRPVLIFSAQDTVTRPLYAYCVAALGEASFDAALQHAFGQPRRYRPQQSLAAVYTENYRRYRQLADFAAQAAW
ncbi:MAG: Xylulose kinase [Anaerolineae bacterium]|nr:Xylulose kinase [Anaerolineae bacterium]